MAHGGFDYPPAWQKFNSNPSIIGADSAAAASLRPGTTVIFSLL